MEEDLRDWLMRSGRFSLRTRTNKGEKVNGALRWPVAVKPHDVGIGGHDLLYIADVAESVLKGMGDLAGKKQKEGCEVRSLKLPREASRVVDAALNEFAEKGYDPDHQDEVIIGYVTLVKGKACFSMQLWLSLENAGEMSK